jgi:hypothetical protein
MPHGEHREERHGKIVGPVDPYTRSLIKTQVIASFELEWVLTTGWPYRKRFQIKVIYSSPFSIP